MLGLILVSLAALAAVLNRESLGEVVADLPSKLSVRLDKLWQIAQQSLSDKKYLRAEKALLMILRIDERNATAYNRLGILYAKQQAYADAIECFEIAQSLEPSPSSLHNVGLIYYETEHYDKAALAFEQALAMEEDVAARHIAYAKVQEKLGFTKKVITSLERAVALDRTPQALHILADAHDRNNQPEQAATLRHEAAQMVGVKEKARRIKQPRRVVM